MLPDDFQPPDGEVNMKTYQKGFNELETSVSLDNAHTSILGREKIVLDGFGWFCKICVCFGWLDDSLSALLGRWSDMCFWSMVK